jgi:hypothetical protein
MHRQGELDLLAIIASNMQAFIVIGCGRAHEFRNLAQKGLTKYNFKMLGIDRLPSSQVPPLQDFEYWPTDIFPQPNEFNPALSQAIKAWRSRHNDPVLFYTDNGNKISELNALIPLLRPNDILGTHDFGTEVPLTYSPGPDFTYLSEYDDYIDANYCMQAFWRRNP